MLLLTLLVNARIFIEGCEYFKRPWYKYNLKSTLIF